jgi:hypothetical protein
LDIQKGGLADSTIFTNNNNNNNNRHIIQKPISIDDLVKQVKVELGKEMHIQIYWFIFQLPYKQTEDVVKVHVVIGKKMHPKGAIENSI